VSAAEHALGGRLALFDPDAVTTTQRELFDRITATAAPWAQHSGFAAPPPARCGRHPTSSMRTLRSLGMPAWPSRSLPNWSPAVYLRPSPMPRNGPPARQGAVHRPSRR
jgi:hypothetical protein